MIRMGPSALEYCEPLNLLQPIFNLLLINKAKNFYPVSEAVASPFLKHLLGLCSVAQGVVVEGNRKTPLLGEVAACAVNFNQWCDKSLQAFL